MENEEDPARKSRLKLWLKRLGVIGFFFFLVKGLVWIGVFVFVGKSCQP
jgi:hypothetical protein